MIRLLNFAHGVVYWQNGILLADAGGKALVELQHVNALTKGNKRDEMREGSREKGGRGRRQRKRKKKEERKKIVHTVNTLCCFSDLIVLVRGHIKNAKFLLRIIVETLESLMKSWFQVPYSQ